jgi:hypothetical protein
MVVGEVGESMKKLFTFSESASEPITPADTKAPAETWPSANPSSVIVQLVRPCVLLSRGSRNFLNKKKSI